MTKAVTPFRCEHCGEDFEDVGTPNLEALEIGGDWVCDECAEGVFEDSSQFGVGA